MPWYEDFFDEEYMRFHLRGGATQAERASAECDFLVRALELKPGDRMLAIPAIPGTHDLIIGAGY